MPSLPSDLAAFAQLLDDQPEPARAAFNYCLALMMVEAGKARLIETRPGEAGTICVFPRRGPMGESSAGERFPLGPAGKPGAAGAECRAGGGGGESWELE